MAAPMLSKNNSSNLKTLVAKEKDVKPTKKNVLCPETIEWPRPPQETTELILNTLSETLKNAPKIFNTKTATDDDTKEEKPKTRDQLRIGSSSVFRALSSSTLECVLVSGDATPAITVDHIISLGKEMGCPLLCLDGFAATFAKATESKVMPLTIGFKKLADGEVSLFSDVIRLVKKHAPVIPTNGGTSKMSTAGVPPTLDLKPTKDSQLPKLFKLDSDASHAILSEFQRIFSTALVNKAKPISDSKKKKRKRKKIIKDPFDKYLHSQFEGGKRCITSAAERNLIEFVLASQEVESVLADCDLLKLKGQCTRSDKCPPILILPRLTETLREMTSGVCCVTFVGVKKLRRLPPGSRQDFKNLTQLCLEQIKDSANHSANLVAEANVEGVVSKGAKNESYKHDINIHLRSTGTCDADMEEDEEEEDDLSYLFVLKENSKDLADHRSELASHFEHSENASSFLSDFISLTAAPSERLTKTNNVTSKSTSSTSAMTESALVKQNSDGTHQPATETTETAIHSLQKSTPDSGFISFSVAQKDEAMAENSVQEKLSGDPTPSRDHHIKSATVATQDEPMLENRVAHVDDRNVDDEQKSQNDGNDETPLLFTFDRSGSGEKFNKKNVQKSQKADSEITPSSSSGMMQSLKQSDALGGAELSTNVQNHGIDYSALDASAKSKQKKNFMKRKLDKQEGFISFAYTEANIKTMVSDVTKKRKKKKKS